jgi:hypothetical protein
MQYIGEECIYDFVVIDNTDLLFFQIYLSEIQFYLYNNEDKSFTIKKILILADYIRFHSVLR